MDDDAYCGLTIEQLLDLLPNGEAHALFMLADNIAPSTNLTIPTSSSVWGRDRERPVPVIPAAAQSIENNLSISNVDFAQLATPSTTAASSGASDIAGPTPPPSASAATRADRTPPQFRRTQPRLLHHVRTLLGFCPIPRQFEELDRGTLGRPVPGGQRIHIVANVNCAYWWNRKGGTYKVIQGDIGLPKANTSYWF